MLTAWDSVSLLDRVVDDVMRGSYGTATNPRNYQPEVDVRSGEDRIVFHFDVPGVKKEDLEITLEKDILTVKGSRKFQAGNPKEQLLLGRSYGTFTRSFSLPDYLDHEHLTASLADGVLTVEIPKGQKAKPRRIQIGGEAHSAQLSDGDEK
jgi:HSP20 family protein